MEGASAKNPVEIVVAPEVIVDTMARMRTSALKA